MEIKSILFLVVTVVMFFWTKTLKHITCANPTNSSSCMKMENMVLCSSERVDINENKTLIYIEFEKNDIFFEILKSLKGENDNLITNRYTLNSELLSLY